jgi:hypothetical protein
VQNLIAISTGRIEEIVMRQFCQNQRLQGQDPYKGIGKEELMVNTNIPKVKEKKRILVPIDVYKAMLNEVRKTTSTICDYREIYANQPDAPVLTRTACEFNSLTTPSG